MSMVMRVVVVVVIDATGVLVKHEGSRRTVTMAVMVSKRVTVLVAMMCRVA